MLVKIEMQEEDVENGTPCNVYGCPIALAVRRLFPGCKVIVGLSLNIIYDNNIVVYAKKLPAVALRFTSQFDRVYLDKTDRKTIKPISFEIEIPEECGHLCLVSSYWQV